MKKLKKITALLLVFILSLSLAGCGEEMGLGSKDIKYVIENGEAIAKEFPTQSSIIEIKVDDEYNGAPVTKIADFAACNLENIEKISIGKNVKEIGAWAFENNQKLKEFDVDPENKYFCDVDGALYTKDMKTLLFYPLSMGAETVTEKNDKGEETEKTVIEYDIPEGVEVIRTKAFYKCGSLTKITFPKSLKIIEEKAFFRCGSLENVEIPENVEFIGKDAFGYCTAFTEISLPASVKEIGEYAFYNCISLKSITVDNKEENLKKGKKWYSTDNGKDMDELKIEWK